MITRNILLGAPDNLVEEGWFHLPIGDLATWAGAIGGFLAFFAVIGQMILESTKRREDALYEQAKLIAVWEEEVPYERYSTLCVDRSSATERSEFIVQNSSSSSIYNLLIAIVPVENNTPGTLEQVLSDPEKRKKYATHIPNVPPFTKVASHYEHLSADKSFSGNIEFSFFDSNNIAWVRRYDGKLEKLKESFGEKYSLQNTDFEFRGAVIYREK